MRVCFLQHDPGSGPGLVGEALQARGATIETLPMAVSIHDPTWEGEFPAVGDHDLIVPLGAIWSVYDHARLHTWVDRELALLREADAQGVPVLGICFGGQALAMAHGGSVESMGTTDIGFSPVTSRCPGQVPEGPWMQWHTDRFVPPADGEVLAASDVGVQAFRLRRNLGLQFHPEATSEIIATWASLGGPNAHAAVREAGTSVDELVRTAERERARARRDIDAMLDWWLPKVGIT